MVRVMWAIVRKDLSIERRTGEMLTSLFLLALLVILLFAFSLEPDRLRGPEFVAGLLWTTLLLAGTLTLNRSFVLERELGAWTALALAPIDRGSIYLGKVIANLIFLLKLLVHLARWLLPSLIFLLKLLVHLVCGLLLPFSFLFQHEVVGRFHECLIESVLVLLFLLFLCLLLCSPLYLLPPLFHFLSRVTDV